MQMNILTSLKNKVTYSVFTIEPMRKEETQMDQFTIPQ